MSASTRYGAGRVPNSSRSTTLSARTYSVPKASAISTVAAAVPPVAPSHSLETVRKTTNTPPATAITSSTARPRLNQRSAVHNRSRRVETSTTTAIAADASRANQNSSAVGAVETVP